MSTDDTPQKSSKKFKDAPTETDLPKRRDRLEALMARREGIAEEQDEAPVPVAKPAAVKPRQRMAVGGMAGGAGMAAGGIGLGALAGGGMAGGGMMGGGRMGGMARRGMGGQPGMMQRRGGMGMAGGAAAGGMGGMQGGGMQAGGMQRKIAAGIMRILTQTAPDDRGNVPGTPFTHTGVAELMRMIGERASNETAPGAKVAASVMRFLAATPGQGSSVEGASVEKLQMLARRIEGRGNGQGF